MKKILCSVLLVFPLITMAAAPVLTPAWQTEAVLAQPESVVFDSNNNVLFVSNVNGNPNDADGNGFISTLSTDGKIIEAKWLAGLNAPKGLALSNGMLYVADINELVVIDIKHKKIVKRYLAQEAKFLNDVAADADGNIYVSDMMTDTLYRLANDSFDVWLQDEGLEAPNGLLVENGNMIVGSWGHMTDGFATEVAGHLKSVDIKNRKITSLGDQTPAGNLDGVEPDGNGNYLVTDWLNGKLLHINRAGHSHTLIDLGQGSADHTIVGDLVIIPMMLSNQVLAFQIR